MKKNLTVSTLGFPFGESERSFFSAEFDVLKDRFSLSLISKGTEAPLCYPFPEEIPVTRYEYAPLADGGFKKKFMQALHIFKPEVLGEVFRAVKGCDIQTKKARIKQVLAFSLNAKQAAALLENIIRRESTDIIYTFWCTEMTLAAVRLKKIYPKLRVVTRFLGADLYRERKATGWQPFRRSIAKGVSHLVFESRQGAKYFADTWGGKFADKCVVAGLGCRAMSRCPVSEDKPFTLVSCSNMIPLKRIELIIGALALLPDLKLEWHHFGDGTERQSLEKLAERRLGPLSGVSFVFHGNIPNYRLDSEYAKIDPQLFITASSTEGGVPVSILEAFASGMPVIATDVGGISEFVKTDDTGILLSANPSCREISDAIRSFYNMPGEERHRLSDNALDFWRKELDCRQNAENMSALLERI